jgi:hypothetical protein
MQVFRTQSLRSLEAPLRFPELVWAKTDVTARNYGSFKLTMIDVVLNEVAEKVDVRVLLWIRGEIFK